MINDADRGVVYEFLPEVSTGEMVVISRRHSDLPGPAPREPGPNGETRRRMADKDEDRAGPGELLRQVGAVRTEQHGGVHGVSRPNFAMVQFNDVDRDTMAFAKSVAPHTPSAARSSCTRRIS